MSIKEFLISCFFPKRCFLCNEVIEYDKDICENCTKTFSSVQIVRNIQYLNGERVVKCISPFLYKGGIRKAILNLKFHNIRSNLKFFASSIAERILENADVSDIDYICYVPMSERNFVNRGYNQSELLAEALSEILKIPTKNILTKIRETSTQHELNFNERSKNLLRAFSIREGEIVRDKNFILCDDIITTGNTLKECVKELKNHGAGEIICCTIASVGW